VRLLVKERSFLLFFIASLISMLGDWALVLALPYYVYGRTGSVLSTGGLVIAELLPRLLFSPIAGVLADRWNRRMTVVGVDLFRAGLVLLILLTAAGHGIWFVYVVAIVESAAAQLFNAASGAMLPTIVSRKDNLLAANSLLSTGASITQLVGPPLGGFLYLALGLGISAIADSASFVVSALALLAIRTVAVPVAGVSPLPGRNGGRLWRELAEGARFMSSNPQLGALCLVVAVAMVGQGMLLTVLVPFVRDVLHFDALEYGVLASAQGFGSLLGAFAVGVAGTRLTRGIVVGWSLMITGLFTLGFALGRHLAVSSAFLFLLSASVVLASIWMETFYQQRVENRLLGRVLGLTENLSALGILCGVAMATALSAALGVVAPLAGAAGVLFAAGVAGVVTLRHATTDDAEPAQPRTVEMPSG
jgi:predicted MFS family arabinose efflux permease